MGTPINEDFDLVAFVCGKDRVIDRQLTPAQCGAILRKTVSQMKPYWKELPFKEGYRFVADPHVAFDSLPNELLAVRFLHIYGGQQFRREEEWGYVTYYITPSRRWLRILTSMQEYGAYVLHEWLSNSDMIDIMAEDPSLLKYLVKGFSNRAALAAATLRQRAEVLDKVRKDVEKKLLLLDSLNQPWARDLPSSTSRLLT